MPSDLTPRQRTILAALARGASNKEIAAEMGISEQGVKSHISRLLARYGATNRTELVTVTRAWSLADEKRYDAMDNAIVDIRRSMTRRGQARGAAVVGMTELQRQSALLSEDSPPEVATAIERLRDVLRELRVAVELANDLPEGRGTKPLANAVKRRAAEAEKQLKALERVVQTARG